jgi:hypothetical protein
MAMPSQTAMVFNWKGLRRQQYAFFDGFTQTLKVNVAGNDACVAVGYTDEGLAEVFVGLIRRL